MIRCGWAPPGAREVRIRRGGNGSRHPPPGDAAACSERAAYVPITRCGWAPPGRVRSASDAAGTGLVTPHPGDAAARSARAGASPERVGEGEAGERVDRERLGRCEAVALDEDVELAQVLRGMPGRALEEVVARLRAVVDTDHALELRRRSALEPAADPGAHERTVARDRRAVAQVGGRPLPEPSLGELAQVHPVHEAERQPEDVVGEVAERAVTLRGSPIEQGLRDDADE